MCYGVHKVKAKVIYIYIKTLQFTPGMSINMKVFMQCEWLH